MCLKLFKRIEYAFKDKPKNTKIINDKKAEDILKANTPSMQMWLNDTKYKTTTFDEYMRYIENSKVDMKPYIEQFHDCNAFAVALWGDFEGNPNWSGLAQGIMFVEGDDYAHAINLFIDNEHDLYLVEPQNDNVWLISDKQEWTPYFLMM